MKTQLNPKKNEKLNYLIDAFLNSIIAKPIESNKIKGNNLIWNSKEIQEKITNIYSKELKDIYTKFLTKSVGWYYKNI